MPPRANAPVRDKIALLLLLAKRQSKNENMNNAQGLRVNAARRRYVTQAYKLAVALRDAKLARKLFSLLTYIHSSNINEATKYVNRRRANRRRNYNNSNYF